MITKGSARKSMVSTMNKLIVTVNAHRSEAFITCDDDCWCWDAESLVDACKVHDFMVYGDEKPEPEMTEYPGTAPGSNAFMIDEEIWQILPPDSDDGQLIEVLDPKQCKAFVIRVKREFNEPMTEPEVRAALVEAVNAHREIGAKR